MIGKKIDGGGFGEIVQRFFFFFENNSSKICKSCKRNVDRFPKDVNFDISFSHFFIFFRFKCLFNFQNASFFFFKSSIDIKFDRLSLDISIISHACLIMDQA